MKRGKILWLLLLLCLTACGQSEEVLPELPAAEIQEAKPFDLASGRILPEEALEYTNQPDCSNGFVLAEREEDGKRFLEFTRPEVPDFSLRINRELTEAVVEYQESTMTLERVETPNGELYDWYVSAGYGGLVSGYSMPFWVDLTGDGQPELAWQRIGYGTGFHSETWTVYDISGQGEIIPIAEPWEEMASSITVEPQGYEDGCIRSLVTDSGGNTYTAWLPVQEEVWQECFYHLGKSGWASMELDEERGVWEAVMAFGLEVPHMFGIYMGELRTEVRYDPEQNAFVRSGPISVSVYEKPEP